MVRVVGSLPRPSASKPLQASTALGSCTAHARFRQFTDMYPLLRSRIVPQRLRLGSRQRTVPVVASSSDFSRPLPKGSFTSYDSDGSGSDSNTQMNSLGQKVRKKLINKQHELWVIPKLNDRNNINNIPAGPSSQSQYSHFHTFFADWSRICPCWSSSQGMDGCP